MPALNSFVKNISEAALGKKNSFLKKEKTSGTVGDMVENQETEIELLKDIRDCINDLGGDGDSVLGKLSGDSDSGSTGGGIADVIDEAGAEKIGGAFSKSIGGSEGFKGILGKLGDLKNMIGGGSGGGGAGASIMAAIQAYADVMGAVAQAISVLTDAVQKGVEQSIINQKQYMGVFSARLQTFTNNAAQGYKDISFQVRNVFTNSRYINQQEMLKNLNSLVEAGIGYNLEDRAYLMTIADKTVSTFNLLDASLNRMIRLQQADLSRPQMGAEAELTQFLNMNFQDTSYLSSMYDTAAAALIDATSQMAREETTGYLFNVQKWLGSLYSVGISDNAINTIAQGLNYLGSGNVSQLTGNDQLNTLFAMSAQRAGLSYAQLLTTGVSEDNVDKLLRSMVEYLQSIAENTSSEVLRNEYGRVFGGLSVSDLRAFQNLTSEDLKHIDEIDMSYKEAYKEVERQIKLVAERTPIAEQVENMFNNLIYSMGAQVAENEEYYTNWVWSNIVQEAGEMLGGVFSGPIGDAIKNTIAFASEATKVSNVLYAITGKRTGKDAKTAEDGLTMFSDYEFDASIYASEDAIEDTLQESYDSTDGEVNALTVEGNAQLLAAEAQLEQKRRLNAITQGIANWDVYSQTAVLDALMPFADKWKEGTARMNNYSSSIALNENAFAEAEAKIQSASNEITGVDDSVRTLDNLYDDLFGDSARPIKVMIVDIDGNLISSATTSQFSSNFEIENEGAAFINSMVGVHAME